MENSNKIFGKKKNVKIFIGFPECYPKFIAVINIIILHSVTFNVFVIYLKPVYNFCQNIIVGQNVSLRYPVTIFKKYNIGIRISEKTGKNNNHKIHIVPRYSNNEYDNLT